MEGQTVDVNFFKKKTLPVLKQYLKDRGISVDGRNKAALVDIAFKAHQLGLEAEAKDDTQEDAITRRTVGGKVLPDPRNIVHGWTSDLRDLPNITQTDVFLYLSEICGWPRQRLKRYKDDNGWQLHVERHVYQATMLKVDEECVYLKAECVPETRQSAASYQPWILINKSGDILSGNCTCVAPNGMCKHVTALLFGLVEVSEKLQESPTSQPCVWIQPTRKKAMSQPLTALKTMPSRQNEPHVDSFVVTPQISPDDICAQVIDLVAGTGALILTSLTDTPVYDVLSESDISPLHVPSIFDIAKSCEQDGFLNKLNDVHDDIACEYISKSTVGQSENPAWAKYRKGRLTASRFKNAFTYAGTDVLNSTTKQCLGLYKSVQKKEMNYGVKMENVARKKYIARHKAVHGNVKVQETGLHVDPRYPFLGASPDGLLLCPECGDGLIEIKCPFTKRFKTCQEACADKTFCCTWEDNGIKLKEQNIYYFQVQGQMFLTGKKYCDFIVHTEKDMQVQRIKMDEGFCVNMVDRLQNFYENFVVPAIFQMVKS